MAAVQNRTTRESRWWFKYRDEPAFELPPSIIDKYYNNVLSIRDVMEYWVKHRE